MSISQIIIAGSGGASLKFPAPGTGSWSSGWGSSPGSQGTPFDPGSGISGASGSWSWGLVRRAYLGEWNYNGSIGNDNPGIFDGTELEKIDDGYVAFDSSTSNIDYYCFEWKGYFQTSTPGDWNFACSADDTCMVWLGDAALNPNGGNVLCNSHNNGGLNYNSPTVGAGLYYPIRIRYQEWTGGESCNVWAAPVDSEPLTLSSYGYTHMYHHTDTTGYL